MRTISWKHPLIALFAATVVAACSSDSSAPSTSGDGGPDGSSATGCGNGKKDGTEKCDKTDLGGATCASLLMSMSATGTPTCKTDCSGFVTTACRAGGGAGGTGGGGTAGTGGGPSGGTGGGPVMIDGGVDGGDAATDAGKPDGSLDSGTGGTAPTTDSGTKDAAKDR
jgi:hypothetical protein